MSDLIERFKSGDPEATREIYREHAGAVYTVARSIVNDPDLAADVVQQTFVNAWRAAHRFEGTRELAPWLYSIARHAAVDLLRSELKPTRGAHEPEVELGEQSLTFEQTWEMFEVRRAIDTLPDSERDIVHRSHLLGFTHQQIAEQLNISIGTVKSRSGRAHKRLAAALGHLSANQSEADDVVKGERPS